MIKASPLVFVMLLVGFGCTAPAVSAPTPDLEQTVQAKVVATINAAPRPTVPTVPSLTVAPIQPAFIDKPIQLEGHGQANTEPFTLAGDYAIDWQLHSGTTAPCYAGAYLRSTESNAPVETLTAYATVNPGETATGKTYTYRRPSGRYYFQFVTTTCDWQVVVSKIG